MLPMDPRDYDLYIKEYLQALILVPFLHYTTDDAAGTEDYILQLKTVICVDFLINHSRIHCSERGKNVAPYHV